MFLEKYTAKKVNSHTFYRRPIIETLFDLVIFDIKKNLLEKSNYCIIFDETTDSCGRHILN